MKKALPLLLFAALLSTSHAQEEGGVEVKMSAEVTSQYLWRGMTLGNVSLQPTLSVGWNGLRFEAWGNMGLSNPADAREIDFTLGYSIGGLELGVTDYWDDSANPRFFQFKNPGTGHTLEAFVSYDFGFLSASWYTNVAGKDGVNPSGDRAWSSYAEVGVPFEWASCQWKATVGVVPFATDYYEVDGFAVTNVGLAASRTFMPSAQLALPLTLKVAANPYSGDMFFVATLGIVWNN